DLPTSESPVKISVSEYKVNEKDVHPLIKMAASTDYELDPFKQNLGAAERTNPPGSGGLLMAFYMYRQLLVGGLKGFGDRVVHGGQEPFYPPKADGMAPKRVADLRVDAEVLRTETAGVPVKWYFSKDDQRLLGFEVFTDGEKADPCEVYV